MSKKRNALVDVQLRAAKAKEKPYKMADGSGLYLYVTPGGGKFWRMDYRNDLGKWQTLSFGEYPLISLQEAREKRDDTRKMKREGRDPVTVRRAVRAARVADANTFEVVCREWHGINRGVWSQTYGDRVLSWMERDAFPYIGAVPVRELTAPQVLDVCRRVEGRGLRETAHRVLQVVGAVCRFAVATGRAVGDPTSALSEALAPAQVQHRAAVTDPKEIGILLRAMDSYRGDVVTKAALRLTPLAMLRPGELRRLEWSEVDLEAAEVRIPAAKMKMKTPHIVPLSRQALAVLRDIHATTGHGKYVFPSQRQKAQCLSENTVRSALIRLGYTGDEQTAHGFRHMASTVLNEQGYNRDVIERQLSHEDRNKVRRTYNYAEYLPERRKMMQDWADYLDGLRNDGNVVAFAVGE